MWIGDDVVMGTEPIIRPTARVLMLDEFDQVLLFRGTNPSQPGIRFWFPPGGGIEAGETPEQAARREVFEETGLADFALGPHIWNRRHVFEFYGDHWDVREQWFFARVPHFEINTNGFTDAERDFVQENRWWSLLELRLSKDVLTPKNLASLLHDLLEHGLPTEPVTIPI